MRAAAVLRALGPIDVKNVLRDSLLRWMLGLPLLITLLFRWGLPPVAEWLAQRFGIQLLAYETLIASFLVMVTPMLFGTVIGFLLLDQKDDQTLTALEVTPLSGRGYLLYRLGVPLLISIALTPVMLELSGLAVVPPGRQLLAALAAAPVASAYALFLASYARNKVQGFALVKAAGALNWPPIIAWFVAPPYQWLFGLCPTYWPVKLYWELDAGGWGAALALAGGLAYLAALNAFLLRRFDRVMHH